MDNGCINQNTYVAEAGSSEDTEITLSEGVEIVNIVSCNPVGY